MDFACGRFKELGGRRTSQRRPGLAWLAPLLLAVVPILGSCGQGEPPLEVGVRDSTGIRIVQLGPLHTPPTEIRLASEPEYQFVWML